MEARARAAAESTPDFRRHERPLIFVRAHATEVQTALPKSWNQAGGRRDGLRLRRSGRRFVSVVRHDDVAG